MTQLGLCVSPGFIPSSAQLEELNPPFLRSILYSFDDIQPLKDTGRPVIITLNNQCREVGSNAQGWNAAIDGVSNLLRGQLIGIECYNEPDLYWVKNNDDVPPDFIGALIRQAYDILKPKGIATIAASVASDKWPEYLSAMKDVVRDKVDYYNIHPYGQRPNGWGAHGWMHGELIDVITNVRNITSRDVICTEYGVKLSDAGGQQGVARFLRAAHETLTSLNVCYASWFTWHDLVGAPSERGDAAFGLMDEHNNKRAAWAVYAAINERVEPVPINPVPINLDKWRQHVGQGLLEMMAQDNTEPVMASEWRPFNRPPNAPATIEECIGMNGISYRWILPANQGFRYKPS